MSPVLKPVALVAVVLAACLSLSPAPSALSPDAAEVQLQMAQLLFNDGRYVEAFDVFEHLLGQEKALPDRCSRGRRITPTSSAPSRAPRAFCCWATQAEAGSRQIRPRIAGCFDS